MTALPNARVRWSLPGHGEPGPTCGHQTYLVHSAMNGESHYRPARRTCGRATCPTCALAPGGWASREADAITARVRAGRPASARLPIHVVISPAEEFWDAFERFRRKRRSDGRVVIDSDFGYPKLRAEAYRMARAHGLLGGACIPHHVRMPTDRWKTKKDGSPSHFRDHCVEGPHFHAIGYGWMSESHPQTERWTVWNLGVRRSVRATAFYCLTHAAISSEDLDGTSPMPDLSHPRGPFETVTWFGSLSYRVRLTVPEDPHAAKCPVCGEEVPLNDWEVASWVGQGPPPTAPGVCRPNEWIVERLDLTGGWGQAFAVREAVA